MQDERQIELLDCTLRDGSYANNFQFTALDVRNICSGLERAGIRRIEIGHGLGIGINSPRYGVAFENDMDYFEAARSVVDNAKIGVFYIPGIGELGKLRDVIENGLDFVRIGVDVTEIGKARSVLEELVSRGLEVHLNLMKTYALPVDDLLKQLDKHTDLDLASIYVVDSAGCMMPAQVSGYVKQLSESGWTVGFHGHNNLELANANCLAALDSGAKYVDGTLAGMGRSAGNAQTEVLSWIIKQAGYSIDVDTFVLFEVVERFLKPLMIIPQGMDVMDVVIGMSRFHSGHLPQFKRAIGKYDVNIYRLIQQVSAIDCVNPSEELIDSVAKDLSRTDG